ncbi:MAG: 50S rRNA methyltransferase [Bdellovibrionales bacterium RIFOXYD1_FULL_53_11]|nr:MAG: 50S rRNA methyltransferase [Bdellovibrionales bacterium RIFOXYD1_FULL_53_11]
MAYNPRDYFFKKAKKENYAARSVYKLEELDERFKIIRPGMKILDLGAAPGSWSQYCSKKTGAGGVIMGIDLQRIELTLPNAVFVQADLLSADLPAIMSVHSITPPFDLVLSDMAPKTTGFRDADQARSLELCELALSLALRHLRGGGGFVCKLFHSGGFEGLRNRIKHSFNRVEVLRPKSTRKESKEIFLAGIGAKS